MLFHRHPLEALDEKKSEIMQEILALFFAAKNWYRVSAVVCTSGVVCRPASCESVPRFHFQNQREFLAW